MQRAWTKESQSAFNKGMLIGLGMALLIALVAALVGCDCPSDKTAWSKIDKDCQAIRDFKRKEAEHRQWQLDQICRIQRQRRKVPCQH